MKNLKDVCNINIPNSLHSLLEASLLGDIEKTLSDMDSSAIAKLYPAPNVNDFKKWLSKQELFWECPKLVQYYINDFTHPNVRVLFKDSKKPMGLYFNISRNKHIETGIYNTDKQWLTLSGVGGVSNTMGEAKKAVIDCIKQILDNPDNLRKLIMFANKNTKEDIYTIEVGDTVSVPYNEIFK